MGQDAGSGLRNVLLWDLSFLGIAQHTYGNVTTTTISMKLWAHLARFSDPNGASQQLPTSTSQLREWVPAWKPEFTDGREQRLTLWYGAEPNAVSHASRYYISIKMFNGCKLHSPDFEAGRTQQNLTGVAPQFRHAAIALGKWLLSETANGPSQETVEAQHHTSRLGCVDAFEDWCSLCEQGH